LERDTSTLLLASVNLKRGCPGSGAAER
jgi:hypothetical protein